MTGVQTCALPILDIDDGIAVENELFAMCFATEDQKEGMGAFLEKRKEKHFQNK